MARQPIRRRVTKPAASDTTTVLPPPFPMPGDEALPLSWGELKSLYRNPPHRKTMREILDKPVK